MLGDITVSATIWGRPATWCGPARPVAVRPREGAHNTSQALSSWTAVCHYCQTLVKISEGLSCYDLGDVPFQTLPDLRLLWSDSESRARIIPAIFGPICSCPLLIAEGWG